MLRTQLQLKLPLAVLRAQVLTSRRAGIAMTSLPSHSDLGSPAPVAPASTKAVPDECARQTILHPVDSKKMIKAVALPPASPYAGFMPVMHHPVYSTSEANAIQVTHHPKRTMTDWAASTLVAIARYGFDFVTRYKHDSPEAALAALKAQGKAELSLDELRAQGFLMTPDMWLSRILFLESVAGVPGMVGGMVRHLSSLRKMKRDGGFINSLLQEAENERMHLMVFLKIKKPSMFFRWLVIGAQGVFFNLFFAAYLVSPRAAHRFVGYLEDQAVVTYTQIANEIKLGHLPEWSTGPDATVAVPTIALDYWRLPSSATMLDLILAVRADEADHRHFNHTVSNLEEGDLNPFAVKHPSIEELGASPGFTREESLAWSSKVQKELGAGEGR